MNTKPDSGWTLPNRFGRALLIEFERLLGANGLVAVLKLSGLSDRGGSPPADDLIRGFQFSEAAALYRGLEEIYGERGARGLIRQANRDAFKHMWVDSNEFVERFGAARMALPPDREESTNWETLARLFGEISDLDFIVLAGDEALQLELSQCPDCLDHRSDEACCAGMLGWLEGAFAVLHPGETTQIHESACQAAGANVCTFIIASPYEARDRG